VARQYPNGSVPAALHDFFEQQAAFTRQSVAANATSDYWRAVGLVEAQLAGLREGYNAAAAAHGGATLDEWTLRVAQSMGDLIDLIPALSRGDAALMAAHDYRGLTPEAFIRRFHERTHCSILVKAAPSLEELWFAHVTWYDYSISGRIFKHYDFRLTSGLAKGRAMSFSSYPGVLASFDDHWTVWDTGLWISETTNDIYNVSLYDLITPRSLLSWQRVRAANLLATTAPEWTALVAEYK
jgi:hypothetical protein